MGCRLLPRNSPSPGPSSCEIQSGFSLVEFLLASLITLAIAGAAFQLLAGAQRSVIWQADMQDVLENVRSAMDAVSRHLRHAANDPLGTGFEGIAVISATEVRLRSDITGSQGATGPDKGDADGDTDDSSENITLRYNPLDRTIEVASGAGSGQAIASNISAFEFRFIDADGLETTAGGAIRGIRISITGEGSLQDPLAGRPFSVQIVGYVSVATRR